MTIRIRFGGQIADAAMRADSIVVKSPVLNCRSRLVNRHEQPLVQALVAELAVKAFDESILDRFAGPNKLKLDTKSMCPVVNDMAAELGSIVGNDRCWIGAG